MSRETALRNYLSEVKDKYDYILIDCMPSLGMVTINALSASDSVIIPVQAQYLPAKGMTQLVQTISRVKKRINPGLKIDGMLLTLVDSRTNLAKSTVEALRENFGSQIKMYRTYIPIAVKAAETSSKGKSIFAYEPNSTVSKAYRSCFACFVFCCRCGSYLRKFYRCKETGTRIKAVYPLCYCQRCDYLRAGAYACPVQHRTRYDFNHYDICGIRYAQSNNLTC